MGTECLEELLKRPMGTLKVWVPGCLSCSHSARFPQPYPCAEDEECGTEEYCSSPSRGGAGVGIQICLACRKRRKRCMRHSMCCPGNYCKNGESCTPLETGTTLPLSSTSAKAEAPLANLDSCKGFPATSSQACV